MTTKPEPRRLTTDAERMCSANCAQCDAAHVVMDHRPPDRRRVVITYLCENCLSDQMSLRCGA
jgi:hypothetical protein